MVLQGGFSSRDFEKEFSLNNEQHTFEELEAMLEDAVKGYDATFKEAANDDMEAMNPEDKEEAGNTFSLDKARGDFEHVYSVVTRDVKNALKAIEEIGATIVGRTCLDYNSNSWQIRITDISAEQGFELTKKLYISNAFAGTEHGLVLTTVDGISHFQGRSYVSGELIDNDHRDKYVEVNGKFGLNTDGELTALYLRTAA